MILHPDGRVEGTPEEVAAYKREMHPKILLNEVKPEREFQYTSAKLEEINRHQAVSTHAVKISSVSGLERYSIDALRNEIARRKKIAEESGQLL